MVLLLLGGDVVADHLVIFMNEIKEQGLIPAKRKRKSLAARKPRVIDPGVAEIRREASDKIKEYHKKQSSARLVKTIIEKRVAQLTRQDQEKLFDHLKNIVTPPLEPLISLPATVEASLGTS